MKIPSLSKPRFFPAFFLGASMLVGGQIALAQEAPVKPAQVVKKNTNQLEFVIGQNSAWGYVLGQRILLEELVKQHPDLKKKAVGTWRRIKKGHLGGSIEGVEQAIKKRDGAKFAANKKEVVQQVRGEFAEEKLDEEEAEMVIELVEGYFKELTIPHEIIRFMTASDPAFLNNPSLEMKSGIKRTFSTKGNLKAKGVIVQMDLPMSWVTSDFTAQNGVWLGQSRAGYGDVVNSLTVMPFPGSVTMEDMKEGLELPDLKEMVPDGAKLITARQAKIGGRDAGMLIFDMVNPAYPGDNVPMRVVQLGTLDEKTKSYIQFQFNVMVSLENKGKLASISKKMTPLFKLMIESVKFGE